MNRRRLLLGIAGYSISLTGCSGIGDTGSTPSPTPKPMTDFVASEHTEVDEVVPYELAIHEETNRVRESRGLETVAYDPQIAYISRKYSKLMGKKSNFGHEVGGNSLTERAYEYGVYCIDMAENLSLRVYDAGYIQNLSPMDISESAVDGWLNSDEGHRENLLSDEWAYEGIGVYVTADARVYVTQTLTARDCDGPGDPPRYGEGYDG
jgi:uncharacterized protein YkwD